MAKQGYTIHGALGSAANAAGQSIGRAASLLQESASDVTAGVNQNVDTNDESTSKLLKDGKEGTKHASNAAKEVATAPIKTVRTIKDLKRKHAKLKKLKKRAKKFGKRLRDFAKDPKKFMKKLKRARKLRRNMRRRGRIKRVPKKGAKAAKNAGKGAKNATKAAENTAKATEKGVKAAIKAIKALIKTAKTLVNAIIKLVKWLVAIIAQYWWVILIIVVIIIILIFLIAIAYHFDNTLTMTGDLLLDSENSAHKNKYSYDADGNIVQTDISDANKILSAYYTYYSTQSLWVLFDGTTYNCREGERFNDTSIDTSKFPKEEVTVNGKTYEVLKPVQYGSKEFVDIYKYDPFTGYGLNTSATLLKDKYNRESSFYLSIDALASLDRTLHGDFRYPEQLVQAVKYKVVIDDASKGTYHFEMDDLADENGLLLGSTTYDSAGNLVHIPTMSTKYTNDASETYADELLGLSGAIANGLWLPCLDNSGNVNQTTPGVWNYGFGSILHYLKYLEAHEYRGEVVDFEVLNKSVWDTTSDNGLTDATYYQFTTSALDGFLPAQNVALYLYKQAQVEKMTYAEWNALDEASKQKYFTGNGKNDDPTHPEFDKNRVYGLPYTDAYLIDYVVTPAGTIMTSIETTWKNSGIPFVVVENDGAANYSDSTFNNDSRFDNGGDPITHYSTEKINVQTVTQSNNGKARFNWSQSCINSANGALLSNPKTNVYLVRYVPTGVAAVDSNFKYVSFTENGTSGYVLKDTVKAINMFSKNSSGKYKCNTCGKAPAVKKYYLNNVHASCTTQKIRVPVLGSTTGETVEYTLKYSGKLSVNSTTGAITSPKAAKPRYYENGEFVFDRMDSSGNPVKNYPLAKDNGKCRICNKDIVKVTYEAENHSSCTTVQYEYSIIKCEFVEIGSQWGLPTGSIYLTRTIAGTKWDNEPTYSGEPDSSGLVGKKYYEDYFKNYRTWLPCNVQREFQFQNIMTQPEIVETGLNELLNRQPFEQSVATLDGIESYFITGVPQVDSTGMVSGYVGPGLGVVAFENGCPTTEAACRKYMEEGATAKPNCTSTLSGEGFPNYGCCQMNRETLDGFSVWMQSDPTRDAMWNKLFGGVTYDRSSESTGFSKAWRNSHVTLTTDEYITFMLYQIAYMYKIKVADQWDTIARYIPEFDNYRASQEMIFACGNNGGLIRAVECGSFGNTSVDIVNGLANVYSTRISFGAYTDVMRKKYDRYIRQYYLIMDSYNLPVFTWDDESEMFASGGSSSGKASWNINRLLNVLTTKYDNGAGAEYYPWNAVFKTSPLKIVETIDANGQIVVGMQDANADVCRKEYISKLPASEVEREIARVFAAVDKVPVSTYIPVTDDFFVLRYQELFSSGISKQWSSQTGMSKYFSNGWSGIFTKSLGSTEADETDYGDISYNILQEYKHNETPVMRIYVYSGKAVSPGSAETLPVSIHSVADGTVLEVKPNPYFGNTYIVAVQYKHAVVYYGGLSIKPHIKEGTSLSAKEVIGTVSQETFLTLEMKTTVNGLNIDPTPLLKGGLSELVEFARQYLGFDYEWGGHGPTSCFAQRCCCTSDHGSYVNGKMWGFDCSGLVTYVCRSLGMRKDSGADPWIALSADGYSKIGQDVTDNYKVNGTFNWDAIPAGTLVFFDWQLDGVIDHVGIWSGEGSLIHASGSNPYKTVNGNMVVNDVTKNHAVHDKMVKEYFLGAVPATAVDSDFAKENGLSTLRANAFNETYKTHTVKLVDISMYITTD